MYSKNSLLSNGSDVEMTDPSVATYTIPFRIDDLEPLPDTLDSLKAVTFARSSTVSYNDAAAVVTTLYNTYLGRSPDPGGLDFYANTLASGAVSPAELAANIANSPEGTQYTWSLEAIIQDIYWSELGRTADSGGLQYYVDVLRRGINAALIRAGIRSSEEAAAYRASLPIVVSPDPRQTAMRTFNDLSGYAQVEYRRGDTIRGLAQQAYGTEDLWWVIAQANKALVDRELATGTKIKIPDVRNSSSNVNVIQIGDNGYAILYVNPITEAQWPEYYVPISSQLEPIEFEENPNWLDGLAFTNGVLPWNPVVTLYSRVSPYPGLPVVYYEGIKGSALSPDPVAVPDNVDQTTLNQLPYYNADNTAYPPPPPIVYVSGTNPSIAANVMQKYPEPVLNTVRIRGVRIAVVKYSIVEYFPALRNQQIPGWPDKMTWDQSPGVFHPSTRTIGIATAPVVMSPSVSVFDHEFGHAYDWAMGYLSRTEAFIKAYEADKAALRLASPTVGYYTKGDKNSPDPLSPTYNTARGEAFSESFSAYYNHNAKWFADKPALLRYFQSFPRDRQRLQP